MEKEQTQQVDQADSLHGRDERVEDVEPVQHVHLKTIVLLIVSPSQNIHDYRMIE
jgi:hypothetical protein